MDHGKTAKKELAFLFVLIGLVLFLRLPRMYEPLDSREGVYAYAASVIPEGAMPYADVFDHKPPMIFYIYRIAFDVFGESTQAVRNITTIYIIFTLLLIYMFARSAGGGLAAMLASFLYVLFMHNGRAGAITADTGVFTQFFSLFGVYFLLDRDRDYEKANFFIAGFLLAAARMTETLFAPAVLGPYLYLLFFVKEKKSAVNGFVWYTLGLAAVIGLSIIWAVQHSMLKNFLECNLKYAFFYMRSLENPPGLAGVAAFAGQNLMLAAALIFSAFMAAAGKDRQLYFMLFIVPALVLAGMTVLQTSAPGYFPMMVPFLSMSAAFMVKDALKAARGAGSISLPAALAVCLAALLGAAQPVYTAASADRNARDGAGVANAESRMIGNELKNIAISTASVFAWPDLAQVYFYSGHKAPGRYVNSSPYALYTAALALDLRVLETYPPDYVAIKKGADEKLFENILKKYYIKSLEGERLALYKKGGIHEKNK
jgi:4-amino-4-deoxy-L-arabinose transferase-like glycosyltransferase